MKKMDKKEFISGRGERAKLIARSDSSDVYRLQDGSFLKIYNGTMQFFCRIAGIDLEKKITSLVPISDVPEIIIPEMAIYDGKNFIGYVIQPAEGISINAYDAKKTEEEHLDISLYAKEHSSLEDVVKRANKHGIVFPDLLSFDNIFITNNNGNVSYNFIDPDGIQFKNMRTYGCVQMSSSLGSDRQYWTPKYCYEMGVLKPNLDKKSLILAYFLSTFNINLMRIPNRQMFNEVMNEIGVYGELRELTEIALFDSKQDNDYLGDIVHKIADEHDLKVLCRTPDGCLKKLVRK